MTQPTGPTDEQLERLGLTRQRWEAFRADSIAREARAPAVGSPAPDFARPLLADRSEVVRLSSFHGKRPVALIFGSYT